MLQYAVLPWNRQKIKDQYFVATRFGSWTLLSEQEMRALARMDINDALLQKLEKDKLIVTRENAQQLIRDFATLNKNIYMAPSLHIIALTSKCNYGCSYCHTGCNSGKPSNKKAFMDKETAVKVLNYIFKSPNKALTIEFQGGETMINWDVLSFIVKQARELNKVEQRDLLLAVVSNLSLLNKEKMDFLVKYNVSVCTSLDGPKQVHDRNRPFLGGGGTYDLTIQKLKELRQAFGPEKPGMIAALPTITKFALNYPKEIIDEYVNLGIRSIHLRFLNNLGNAKDRGSEINYTVDQFVQFWKTALDYIIELNERGIKIEERTTRMLCSKLLRKSDPLYTEMMSPCGAGRGQVAYTEDGSVYTCDEGRMLDTDVFKMGDVDMPYQEVYGSDTIFQICQASMLDAYEPTSPFISYLGFCPVQSLSTHNNILLNASKDFGYQVLKQQMTYVLEKILEGKKEIFLSWFT